MSGFLKALGITDVATYDPHALWQANSASPNIEFPIGTGWDAVESVPNVAVRMLDIVELALGGDGHHGAIQGMVDSALPHLMSSMVTSLCTTQGPDKVSVILADFFEEGYEFRGLDALPHVLASVNNLKLKDRGLRLLNFALAEEMDRRKHLFNQCGVMDFAQYQQRRTDSADIPALPHIVMFLNALHQYRHLPHVQPELKRLFALAAQGRSLGFHLIPCEQFFTHESLGVFSEHVAWGISLRVPSSESARFLVNSTEPLEFPKDPGVGMLFTADHNTARYLCVFDPSDTVPGGEESAVDALVHRLSHYQSAGADESSLKRLLSVLDCRVG